MDIKFFDLKGWVNRDGRMDWHCFRKNSFKALKATLFYVLIWVAFSLVVSFAVESIPLVCALIRYAGLAVTAFCCARKPSGFAGFALWMYMGIVFLLLSRFGSLPSVLILPILIVAVMLFAVFVSFVQKNDEDPGDTGFRRTEQVLFVLWMCFGLFCDNLSPISGLLLFFLFPIALLAAAIAIILVLGKVAESANLKETYKKMDDMEKQLAEEEKKYDSQRKEAFAALEAAEASMESILNSMAAQLKTRRGYQGEE